MIPCGTHSSSSNSSGFGVPWDIMGLWRLLRLWVQVPHTFFELPGDEVAIGISNASLQPITVVAEEPREII